MSIFKIVLVLFFLFVFGRYALKPVRIKNGILFSKFFIIFIRILILYNSADICLRCNKRGSLNLENGEEAVLIIIYQKYVPSGALQPKPGHCFIQQPGFIVKRKNLFKMFVQNYTHDQCQLRCRTELPDLNGTDRAA